MTMLGSVGLSIAPGSETQVSWQLLERNLRLVSSLHGDIGCFYR